MSSKIAFSPHEGDDAWGGFKEHLMDDPDHEDPVTPFNNIIDVSTNTMIAH